MITSKCIKKTQNIKITIYFVNKKINIILINSDAIN